MLTATSSQPINTTSTTTNMELQPLKDALKEMQQQEELQMLKSLGSTLQATTDYRSEILQNLTKTVKGNYNNNYY